MDISFSSILAWFRTTFDAMLSWIKDATVWVFDYTYNIIVTALEAVIDIMFDGSTGLVSTFVSFYQLLQSHSSGISYVTGTLNITYGLTVMGTALAVRFVIRRIPLIG